MKQRTGSAKYRNYPEKKWAFSRFAHATVLVTLLLVVLVFVSEAEGKRSRPLQVRARAHNSSFGRERFRQIKAKRQQYNAALGLLNNQFPFTLLIGKSQGNPDQGLPQLTLEQHIAFNASQKMRFKGYAVQEHTVETEDGYLLTLFQMRNPNCTLDENRAPILFMHGVLDSADTWLVLGGDDGAPYQAANYQYEVWLGNARGNNYGNRHKTLSTKDPKFWNFSWHEIGTRDLPAIFKFILEHTETNRTREKINYIGHSMGTTIFYACLSTLPEWNKHIDLFVALPPSAFLTEITSPLAILKPYSDLYNNVLIDGPFLPSEINHLVSKVAIPLCEVNVTIANIQQEAVCNALVYFGQGNSREDTNSTILQRVFGHFPSTTSKKLIAHFLQLVGEDRFTEFDFGSPLKNFKNYNQTFPPSYNLYNVDVNSVSYYGQRDLLIARKDSEENLRQLGTSKAKFNVLVMDYSHLDFIWGNTAGIGITSRFLAAFDNFYDPRTPPQPNPMKTGGQKYGSSEKKDSEKNGEGEWSERVCTCACNGNVCHEDVDDGLADYDTEEQPTSRIVEDGFQYYDF